uniref:Uncharacterized protein n=1 Tax=Nothoprocta perdicaria TaxID=30464 RepID=A0A8C6ZG22_NOTPE
EPGASCCFRGVPTALAELLKPLSWDWGRFLSPMYSVGAEQAQQDEPHGHRRHQHLQSEIHLAGLGAAPGLVPCKATEREEPSIPASSSCPEAQELSWGRGIGYRTGLCLQGALSHSSITAASPEPQRCPCSEHEA